MKNSPFFFFSLLFLSACTSSLTQEQELDLYRKRCLAEGYPSGSVEFTKCVENQEAQAREHQLREKERQERAKENYMKRREHHIKEKETAAGTCKINLW